MYDLGPGVVNIAFLCVFAYIAVGAIRALCDLEEVRAFSKRRIEEEHTLQAIETTKQVEIAHRKPCDVPRDCSAIAA